MGSALLMGLLALAAAALSVLMGANAHTAVDAFQSQVWGLVSIGVSFWAIAENLP